MKLLKCCTQYASKFGKLSSGHRTGKGQFSFQSQSKAMPKNLQNTVQLHSFHMLARLCSKSFKVDFNSTWTKKFQMYKLDFEKAQEPKIKLSTYNWIIEKAREFKKKSTSASLNMLKSLTVDYNKLWNILKKMRIPDHLICLLSNPCTGQETTIRSRTIRTWNKRLVLN